MRTTRNGLVAGCLLAVSLPFVWAGPAVADPPTKVGPFVDIFEEVNPCTGLVHVVTRRSTFFAHDHRGTEVGVGRSVLSTSSGFSGQGTGSITGNSQIRRFRSIEMLTNDEGDRIQRKGVFVLDLSTRTVRVDKFRLTCVGS